MDIMKPVVVTLSTPRCGTQWLAQTIRDLHGDAVVAEHEPLENQYLLRKFFRRFESIDEQLNVEAIRDHIARINDITRSKIYIEVGYQACAAIPLFIREFQERIRIIHLYRNPVLTAYSMVTLGYYKFRSPEDEQQNVLSMLDPRQDHVAFRDYAAKWQNMSPFARSLYFWLEINQYAQELRQRYSGIPFLAVRSEDMFASADHLAAVLRWIGLPEDERTTAMIDRVVDVCRFKTRLSFETKEIMRMPEVLDLARRMGYSDAEMLDVEDAKLARYKSPITLPYNWAKLIDRIGHYRTIRTSLQRLF
jgi:hypothetical protein